MKRSINIWMQMIGFNKDDADRGVSRFLDRTGFIPDSICALLFHPDFVHLYNGIDTEYPLFPDNCAYRAVLRNTERYRQSWTNLELRELVAELKKKGIKFYAGFMGVYADNRFHDEWLSHHPEVRACTIDGSGELMCLKRLNDGSYYEDFFIEKLVKVLVDYDMAGVHLADAFCPSGHIYKTDYSTDMVEQFISHTKTTLPDSVMTTLTDDSPEAARVRQRYIWAEKRKEWIEFYEWRWESFFKKMSDTLHSVGKEVWILGMYCSDPFETRYVYGFDTRKVMEAGVDCITANILPSSVYFEQPQFPYYFHRMHMDLPLLRTQIDNARILSMVSIHDASEEWSMIDHAPVRVERDVYTGCAFVTTDKNGTRPCSDGVFLCLGDGVEKQKWDFIKKRLDIGFGGNPTSPRSPLLVWSDTAHEKMLHEYVNTRRTTPHKQGFEIFKAGAPFSGAIRSESLKNSKTTLFVPNYDMLSNDEKQALSEYKHPWVATVPASLTSKELTPDCIFTDRFSDYPMSVFACNLPLNEIEKNDIEALISADDGVPSESHAPEGFVHPPIEELPFAKLSAGFVKACAILLNSATTLITGLKCNHPFMINELENGFERLYFFNKYDNAYVNAVAESDRRIEEAEIVSDFPVLPVKFIDTEDKSGYFDYEKASTKRNCFQIRMAPDGLTIIDIKRKQ